jgi:hypothetical protein
VKPLNLFSHVMARAKALCERAVTTAQKATPSRVGGLVLPMASFSIDVNSLLGSAEDIFNGLFPAFAIAIGLTIGLGLIALIAREIRKSF